LPDSRGASIKVEEDVKNSPNILESDPKGDVSKQQLGTTPIDFRYEYFSDKE